MNSATPAAGLGSQTLCRRGHSSISPPSFLPTEVSMTRHTATASRNAARILAVGLLAAGLAPAPFGAPAWADDKPDPVVAKIGTAVIHLSDVPPTATTLPPQARQT